MPIEFPCGYCGQRYQVDGAQAGKTTRCKVCGKRMTVPRPAEIDPDDDGNPYTLAEPITESVAPEPTTFVPAPPDSEPDARSPRHRPRPHRDRDEPTIRFPQWKWLVGTPLALLVVVVPVALLFPTARAITGMVLAIIGMGALLVGFGIGAFAAFSEDILYGFLYLFIPFYTGYYLISRLEGTWPLLAAMAGAAALITVGVWLMEAGKDRVPLPGPEPLAARIVASHHPILRAVLIDGRER